MLYLREFKNHSGYTQEELNLVAPNVSYCDDANDVHYKLKIPDNSVLFMCENIQPNTTEEVRIYSDAGHGYDTVTVDKNNILYKYICTNGFNCIAAAKNIISSVTLNKIDKIYNSGQNSWFPTNVKSVSIKDCIIPSSYQLANMCSGCTSLTSFEATNFNTVNATSMESAFSGCHSLKALDLSGLNANNVTNMTNLFNGCQNLKKIDISTWELQSPEAITTTGIFGTDSDSYVGNGSFEIIIKRGDSNTKQMIENILNTQYNSHEKVIDCTITQK